jgi:hypothetical protein
MSVLFIQISDTTVQYYSPFTFTTKVLKSDENIGPPYFSFSLFSRKYLAI